MISKAFFGALFFGIALSTGAIAQRSGTIMVDGQALNYYQNGSYLSIDGETYVISQVGSALYVNTLGPRSSNSATFVPNLTPEQAKRYLNSTAEGRAASAKFDADLAKSQKIFDAELAQMDAKIAHPAPRAALVDPYPTHRK